MPVRRNIYEEALAHLRASTSSPNMQSETTKRAISIAGPQHFTFDQLERMLAPGNPVNRRLRDIYYLIDPSAIDLNDRVTQQLLACVEDQFGQPELSIAVAGRTLNSFLLHSVAIARRVIRATELIGRRRPTIVEIGGGLGLVLGILRRYYGDGATLCAIDVPETLFLQEWYVRNCDPGAETAFHSEQETSAIAKGGVNFINAAIWKELPTKVDVAFSVDAFSDMSRETCCGYFTTLSEQLSPDGRFLLIASYGQGEDGVPTPSEYPIGEGWRIEAVELLDPNESMQPEEQLLVQLRRDQMAEPNEQCNLHLRVLWNLFAGRLIANNNPLGAELVAAIDRSDDPIGVISQHIDGRVGRSAWSGLDRLRSDLYLPPETFRNWPPTFPVHAPSICMDDGRRTVIQAMVSACADQEEDGEDRIRDQLESVLAPLKGILGAFRESVFWTAQAAGILFPLTRRETTAEYVADAGRFTCDPNWRVRCATLLDRYGFRELALELLAIGDPDPIRFPFLSLKTTELFHRLGKVEEARRRIQNDCQRAGQTDGYDLVLAKTALRLGDSSLCANMARRTIDAGYGAATRDMLEFMISELPDGNGEVGALLEHWWKNRQRVGEPVGLGVSLYRSGDRERGRTTAESALDWSDHYRLGGDGRRLLSAGLTELGRTCLEASAKARKNSFLHMEFIGNAFMSAGLFSDAQRYFSDAVSLCPYLPHLHGREAYAALPSNIRQSGIFGTVADIPVIFQRWQDFYHDIGPRFR